MKKLFLLFITLFTLAITFGTQQAKAQVTVRGQILDAGNRKPLYPATIRNKNRKLTAFADKGGFYRINAYPADTLVFSFLGYEADTLVVKTMGGNFVYDVSLSKSERFLTTVEVSSKYNAYQLDSMARREEFSTFLDLPKQQLAETNTHTGFGLVFSPFTRYSRKEKDKRKFQEYFAKNEESEYIGFRYSRDYVGKVSGLSGDSLTTFMSSNMPKYADLRAMSNEDLVFWISERALKFRGKKP
ncbi:carboxypeptidase-like protein [Chitinophaga skermanii]|uniref:Carboxypeptidase-like protein n=1 Tax=Chitinophaga skermanii TaxID=331697 RepID=A0A327Q8K2_9BACT|nr:carboxypeptidase-like regulatory domain-containing protein [Chitinophaga skermanii]RAJ00265.1 carboxypeptidase-like protein [Chitinophaga skermanii]